MSSNTVVVEKASWTLLRTVRERDGSGHIRTVYVCRCTCGKVSKLRLWSKNYGCKSCANRGRTGKKNGRWNGCGELSGYVWSHIRTNARRRGLALRVTVEQAWDVYVQQDGFCAYTGWPIDFVITSGRKQGLGTASLDRIDSSKPYVLSNIQWVHKDVNLMKRDLPEDRFLEICRAITANRR